MAVPYITLNQSGIPAVGCILYLLNLDSPGYYIPIGNLGNMKWEYQLKDADTTNQGTTWMQGIPTLNNPGELTADIHFIPDSQGVEGSISGIEGHSFLTGLGWIATQRQVRTWKQVWSNTAGNGFYNQGYITNFPIDMNIEKDLLANFKLKFSGAPTFF